MLNTINHVKYKCGHSSIQGGTVYDPAGLFVNEAYHKFSESDEICSKCKTEDEPCQGPTEAV